MLESTESALRRTVNALPPLGRDVRPNLAAAIGFITGGIGLAIYFRTFIDLVVPLAIGIVALLLTIKFVSVELGWLPGAVIASLYGYVRASNSNGRRRGVAEGLPHPSPV